ncbi:MAG: interleukin-like EMT inducer domain-containing protein [Thermodesulfobacteriota bacterium]
MGLKKPRRPDRPDDQIDQMNQINLINHKTLTLTLTLTLTFALLLILAFNWAFSSRSVRLKIGDYYFTRGNYDQALNWYEKVVRKEKLKTNQDKSDRIKYEEDLYKLKSAIRQQGDYYLGQSNFDQAANCYGRLVSEERLKGLKDRGDRLEYAEDLSKLKLALHRQMEERLLKVSQFLGFGQNKDLKSLLEDPKLFLKDIHELVGPEPKEELLNFDNISNNFKSLFGKKTDSKELDYLISISYFFKGFIDEAEDNFALADSNYEKAIKLSPSLSNVITERKNKILPGLSDEYFYRSPLNWGMAKELSERLIRANYNKVDLFVRLGYLNAKYYNNISNSYGYFMQAYELLNDDNLRKIVQHFKNKGTFLYPEDINLIPKKIIKQYSLLREISFSEIKNLLRIVDVKVTATSNGFIGKTGIKSPVDIIIRSAGYLVGNYSQILINGENVSQISKGYNIVVMNSQTGKVEKSVNFDTYGSKDDVTRMKDFIIGIEKNKIVCVAVADDASLKLSMFDGKIFEEIGARENLHGRFRWGHGIIGVKGAKSGEAIEAIGEKPLEIYVISQNP